MNPKHSWSKIVTVLALIATGAACADRSSDLGGAALPQEAATGAENDADIAPVGDDAAAIGADAIQPEAGIIPTPPPRIRVTMADINVDEAVRFVTAGRDVSALGLDQLVDVEKALFDQIAMKLGARVAARWVSAVMCVWTYTPGGKPTLVCTVHPEHYVTN